MQTSALFDRRRFLRLSVGSAMGALLSGCGGGGAAASGSPITVVPAAPTAAVAATPPLPGSHPLNLALNLAYLGAAFYGHAARGTGISPGLTSGVGRAGVATGARAASFADADIAAYAAELADDKAAHVAALRTEIGALAAAQPAIDLSTATTGAFSFAAQQAGIVAPGASFDPYASDAQFLLGAFLIEDTVAAAHRTLLVAGGDAASSLVGTHLADAIYHGGLIRSLLDARANDDPSSVAGLAKASSLLASLDGTGSGDQTLSAATGSSANILDAGGLPIPFTRETAQVLRVLYLSGSGGGGFLPVGANGIA